MWFGLFHTSRPAGVDRHLWNAVRQGSSSSYSGPSEREPSFVEPHLAEVRAQLTRIHHEDIPLNEARRQLDGALLEFRLSTDDHRVVETENSLAIQAGRAARNRIDNIDAAHLRSDGARASQRIEAARARLNDSQRRAELCNVGVQNAADAVYDQMMIVAREAIPPLQRYLALMNLQRIQAGAAPLPELPIDLVDQLVLDARRRAGEALPDH
ncbi:MAG: hypothetical protein WCK21_00055 [Actinomycetota bacterium]